MLADFVQQAGDTRGGAGLPSQERMVLSEEIGTVMSDGVVAEASSSMVVIANGEEANEPPSAAMSERVRLGVRELVVELDPDGGERVGLKKRRELSWNPSTVHADGPTDRRAL